MFEIDERFMMEIASTRDVYNKGKQLANSVENISVNSKKVSGVVKSNPEYNVNVEFKGASTLKNYECECDDYYTEPGACKHVVALLEAVRRDSMNKTRPEGIRNSYISFSTVESINPKKNCLNLYIEQVFMQDRGRYSLVMRVKIGKTRPYVVKNIISLLDSIRDEKTVYFGKNLTVDFKTEGFTDNKAEITDFLCEILKRERELKNNAYYYSYMPSSNVFVNDDVVLYGDNLRSYLALTKDMGITTDCGGVIGRLKVIDDIPLEINLREEDGIIVMEADYGKDRKILPLTEDCSVVLAPKNAEAYLVPKEKRNLVKAVYNARLQKKMPVFSIDKDEQNGFIRQYLPRLKKTNEVKCSGSLSEKLSKTHLVPRVYFDSAEGEIFARVDFCYGSNVIVYGDNGNDSGLIVRDTDYEKRVVEFLEDAGMKFKENRFSTWDDEIIVQILTSKAELLREFCEVYYSEAFKSLNVRSVGRVSMGVRLNSESLLEFDFNVDGVGEDELSQIIMSVREKKKYYRLKNGNILNIENKELLNISNLLDDLDIDERKVKAGNVKLASSKALYIDNFIRENEISNVSVNENFERLISDIINPPDYKLDLDDNLEGVLRNYQKFGFKWLKTLSQYGFGGILADDMGLGKTLQVLSFIKSEKLDRPCMVVAPTSLIYNWKAETEKFVPSLKVLVISGTKPEREIAVQNINDYDIAVTSYGSLKRDMDLYDEIMFSYVFIDEAQHIKNPATLNAGSVKSLKSKGCFALTGTPIENTLTELWSIFDFIMPGYLMNHNKFVTKFESPIVRKNDKEALKTLSRYIRPFILRRLKCDVLKELPEKIESKMVCDMTADQKKLYAAYLKKAQNEVAAGIKSKGFDRSKIVILAALTRLRQVCCHPGTFVEEYRGGSGKLDVLNEVLQDSIEAGHRILVFSQFTEMLGLILKELQRMNIGYFYLDGSVKAVHRLDMVERFNNGENSVFLISLKAGGTGLNLTGADIVIHFDPWWNPSVEDQATDRAYRIGQKKAVQVFRLVTKGTIEEKILELQDKKRGLINSVIKPGENLLTKLGEEEIRELFHMQT